MKSGRDYATFLEVLATAIQKTPTLKGFDPASIYTLAQQCRSLPKANPDWKYDLVMDFPRESFKTVGLDKVRPKKRVKSFSVTLSIKAGGPYIPEKDSTLDETINALDLNLITKGYKFEKEVENEPASNIMCAWHLDIQPIGQLSPFAHPRFHWQYGGKKVWSNSKKWFGSHLLLVAPRLAHPPLDAILAIDFILSNYYAPTWQALQSDPTYSRVIATAQKLYWEPYYRAIATGDWSSRKALPFMYWPQ